MIIEEEGTDSIEEDKRKANLYKYKARNQKWWHNKSHLDIYLDEPMIEFKDIVDNTKMLLFLIVKDSNPEKEYENADILDEMLFTAIKDIGKGYFKTYVFDCQSKSMQEAIST